MLPAAKSQRHETAAEEQARRGLGDDIDDEEVRRRQAIPPGQETMVKVAVPPTFLKSKAELTKGSVSRLRFLLLAQVTGPAARGRPHQERRVTQSGSTAAA